MSGGTFNYMQQRYEWNEAVERIQSEINNRTYNKEVTEELKEGLQIIQNARVYLERIDYLFEGNDSEESFLKRLKEELHDTTINFK